MATSVSTETVALGGELVTASILCSPSGMIVHRDLSGLLVYPANLEFFPEAPDFEDLSLMKALAPERTSASIIQRWWRSLRSSNYLVIGSADVKVREKKKTKKPVSGLVFGDSPFRFSTGMQYACILQRSSLKDLVEFYKASYGEKGEKALVSEVIYRSSKRPGQDDSFFESTEKGEATGRVSVNLRAKPRKLFERRYCNVFLGDFYEDRQADIFRIVRFCSIRANEMFPNSFVAFKNRFPFKWSGMKRKAYDEWMKRVKRAVDASEFGKLTKKHLELVLKLKKMGKDRSVSHFNLDFERKELKKRLNVEQASFYRNTNFTLPVFCGGASTSSSKKKKEFAFGTWLERRFMQENMKTLQTCSEYWLVARDFPSYIMNYLLKRCERKASCSVCKAMHAFHKRNLQTDRIESMLYPDSPFLRTKGKLMYSKNMLYCISKWKRMGELVPRFAKQVSKVALQRTLLLKHLVDMRMRRATTIYEVPNDQKQALDLMFTLAGPLFLFNFFPDDSMPVKDSEACLLAFVLKELKVHLSEHSIVRLSSLEFTLSSDFVRELEFYLFLRSHKVYENLLPAGCREVLFPNSNLRGMLHSKYPYDDSGPVCFAFARRWRVCDLLKRMKRLTASGVPFFLHVDTKAPIVFDPRDDLQDWFKDLYVETTERFFVSAKGLECFVPPTLKTVDHAEESVLMSYKEVRETKRKVIRSVSELKVLMDRAVAGECYLFCNNEKKRKFLLESALEFRGDKLRSVLERQYPSSVHSVYNLIACRCDQLVENEATITLPRTMSVFCPRKEVYCIGDMWTESSRSCARFLATDTLYEVDLKDMSDRFKFWQYNDAKVRYADGTVPDRSWKDVGYSRGAFERIHKFVAFFLKESDEGLRKRRLEEKEHARKLYVKKIMKEQQIHRERKRRDEERERKRRDKERELKRERSIEDALDQETERMGKQQKLRGKQFVYL